MATKAKSKTTVRTPIDKRPVTAADPAIPLDTNTHEDDARLASRLTDLFTLGLHGIVDVTEFKDVVIGYPEQIAAAVKRDLAELKAMKAKPPAPAKGGDVPTLLPDPDVEKWVNVSNPKASKVRVGMPVLNMESDSCVAVVIEIGKLGVATMNNDGELELVKLTDIQVPPRGGIVDRILRGEGKHLRTRDTSDPFYMAKKKINEAVVEARIAYDLWQESKPERDGENEMAQVESAFNTADSALSNLSDNFVEAEIYAARLTGGEA